jgi:hypothetical protein
MASTTTIPAAGRKTARVTPHESNQSTFLSCW